MRNALRHFTRSKRTPGSADERHRFDDGRPVARRARGSLHEQSRPPARISMTGCACWRSACRRCASDAVAASARDSQPRTSGEATAVRRPPWPSATRIPVGTGRTAELARGERALTTPALFSPGPAQPVRGRLSRPATRGSQGVPWYVDFRGNRIGSVDPRTMETKEYPLPNAGHTACRNEDW